MKAIMRPYRAPQDFFLIRDFLKTAYYSFSRPTNWGLERWNWGRYHPSMFSGDIEANIRHFESSIRIWQDEKGRVLAVLNTEQPKPNGEVWIQRIPEADKILDEILETAERELADPKDGILHLDVYDHDEALLTAVKRRGYSPPSWKGHFSEMDITGLETPKLEAGFRIRSMAEAGLKVEERCRVQGLGFDHSDPAEWMRPEEYAQVRQAPDYRAELDLIIESPRGDYASMCIVWYDDYNKICFFEPVCTPPEYRKRGMGRAVIREGLNRAYKLGARKAYVGSGQDFYASIGFKRLYQSGPWEKHSR